MTASIERRCACGCGLPTSSPSAKYHKRSHYRDHKRKLKAEAEAEAMAKKKADSAKPAAEVLWAPHPGPQTEFVKSKEYEVFFGGAAGGGKSDAALHLPLRHIDNPNFRCLILRKTFPELQELIERSSVYRHFGAGYKESKRTWYFPSGATVEFGFFELWKHHVRYQGREFQLIIWDELGTVPEERFWTFLMSRNRSADPTIPTQMRGTGNPGGAGHMWLRNRIIDKCGMDGGDVYTDPSTGLTRRFIPSRLEDNPTLELNDPGYRKRLESLPEVMKLQLLYGDWGASAGMALHELRPDVHLVEPHTLPPPWEFFGAFDWGYQHPASFGLFAAGLDQQVMLVDSAYAWRKSPIEIVDRIHDTLDKAERVVGRPIKLKYIHAGRDCWSDYRARGENTPTVAEQFAQEGLFLSTANQARVAGLNNMRAYATLIGPEGSERPPRFRVFNTPTNRMVFKVLQSMVTDPSDPEDALKVDADAYGQGGDDAYDMVRYGLASRPLFPMRKKKREERLPDFDNDFRSHIKNLSNAQRRPTLDRWLKSGRLY